MARSFLARLVALVAVSLALPAMTGAAARSGDEVSAYRQYIDVPSSDQAVPSVVEAVLDDIFLERGSFKIQDLTDQSFEPYLFISTRKLIELPAVIKSAAGQTREARLADGNLKTFVDYPLPQTGTGTVDWQLFYARPITSSALTILLSPNAAMPSTIEIRAEVNGVDTIVVAQKKLNSQTVRFPATTASRWRVAVAYKQPLRIAELDLRQEKTTDTLLTQRLRWLAQPDRSYRIYLDPDREVRRFRAEAANLRSNEDVVVLPVIEPKPNPQYVIADGDRDGIPDIDDNCVDRANPDQADVNGNGRGDVCDDFDKDGVMNERDNCPNNPNRLQKDVDGDGIGDACDKQESRLTERHAWIPWAGIGLAAVVIVVLFTLTANSMRVKNGPEDIDKPT